MRTDPKGFVYGEQAPRVSRINVAIRAPELKALRASKNPSLRVLATRVQEAIEAQDLYWLKKREQQAKIEAYSRERQAKIDADPKLKAEQEERRSELARAMARGGLL